LPRKAVSWTCVTVHIISLRHIVLPSFLCFASCCVCHYICKHVGRSQQFYNFNKQLAVSNCGQNYLILLKCYFAICVSHLRLSSGVYKQQNLPTITATLRFAVDPLVIILSFKCFCTELQCLNVLKYLSKNIRAYL
jgi:hypothetical protein